MDIKMEAGGMATSSDSTSCIIEATVPTGFEEVAKEEAIEKFGTECTSSRGNITFSVPINRVKDVLQLGGIDNFQAQVYHVPNFGFTSDPHDCLSRLQLLVKTIDWSKGLDVWQQFYSFEHPILSAPERILSDEELLNVCIVTNKTQPQNGGENDKNKKMKGKDWRRHKGGKGESKKGNFETEKQSIKMQEREEGKNIPGMEFQSSSLLTINIAEDVAAKKDVPLNESSSSDPSSATLIAEQDMTSSLSHHVKVNPEGAVSDAIRLEWEEKTTMVLDLSQNPDTNFTLHRAVNAVQSDNAVPSLSPSKFVDIDSSPQIGGDCAPDSTKSLTANISDPGFVLEDSNKDKGDVMAKVKPREDPTKPAFRVTCNRIGDNHSFDSLSAASSFGSAVQKFFGWNVDMKNFDIEVILNIDNEDISVGINITKESLHFRNLVVFGATTLRPTICHNMLRMCKIQDGHIVCDPLCGSGSIPIQRNTSFLFVTLHHAHMVFQPILIGVLRGHYPFNRCAVGWPNTMQICGEIHQKSVEKTETNKRVLSARRVKSGLGGLKADVIRWDACRLPLRDSIVDAFVTDLPFGKRVGTRKGNRKLYPLVLDEMARVGKYGAQACILTEDRKNIMQAIHLSGQYWQRRRILSVNIGGIGAGVFLLWRTSTPYNSQFKPFSNCHKFTSFGNLTSESNTDTTPTDTKESNTGQISAAECGLVTCPFDNVCSALFKEKNVQESKSIEEEAISSSPFALDDVKVGGRNLKNDKSSGNSFVEEGKSMRDSFEGSGLEKKSDSGNGWSKRESVGGDFRGIDNGRGLVSEEISRSCSGEMNIAENVIEKRGDLDH